MTRSTDARGERPLLHGDRLHRGDLRRPVRRVLSRSRGAASALRCSKSRVSLSRSPWSERVLLVAAGLDPGLMAQASRESAGTTCSTRPAMPLSVAAKQPSFVATARVARLSPLLEAVHHARARAMPPRARNARPPRPSASALAAHAHRTSTTAVTAGAVSASWSSCWAFSFSAGSSRAFMITKHAHTGGASQRSSTTERPPRSPTPCSSDSTRGGNAPDVRARAPEPANAASCPGCRGWTRPAGGRREG